MMGWFRHNVPVEEVLAERPFAHYLTIKDISPIEDKNAKSGQTFFITTTDNRRFKLRKCANEKEAIEVENNVRKFQHIFPKFYGRDGSYILMEALIGYRQITKEELIQNLHKIGRICAEIHKASEVSSHDQQNFFKTRLGEIKERGIIDEVTYRKSLAFYDRSIEKIQAKVSLELHDIHEGNFMINEEGNILFVDEQSIAYRVKGLGLGKLLKKLKRDDEWRAFMQGYQEIEDGRYLTPEYLTHIQAVEAVRSINFKTRKGTDLDEAKKDLERLKKIIES